MNDYFKPPMLDEYFYGCCGLINHFEYNPMINLNYC